MSKPLSDSAAAALKPCFATRGKHKGMLKAKPPSPFQFPAEYAAYQGAMLACNPFKASIVGMMLMQPQHKAICDEVCAYIEARPHLVRALQSDRNILEKLGAW